MRVGRDEATGRQFLAAPTFTQWLLVQRPAAFGALAEFALSDHARGPRCICWPLRARRLLAYVRHVREAHADDPAAPSERDVRTAFVAFEREMAQGVRLASSFRRLPAEHQRVAANYSVAATTFARIERLAATLGSRGAVIDMLVERYDATE